MTEQELYARVVALREETERLIDAAMELPPTIELCVFTGKLSGAYDVLLALEEAGEPIGEPDEEPHPLVGKTN